MRRTSLLGAGMLLCLLVAGCGLDTSGTGPPQVHIAMDSPIDTTAEVGDTIAVTVHANEGYPELNLFVALAGESASTISLVGPLVMTSIGGGLVEGRGTWEAPAPDEYWLRACVGDAYPYLGACSNNRYIRVTEATDPSPTPEPTPTSPAARRPPVPTGAAATAPVTVITPPLVVTPIIVTPATTAPPADTAGPALSGLSQSATLVYDGTTCGVTANTITVTASDPAGVARVEIHYRVNRTTPAETGAWRMVTMAAAGGNTYTATLGIAELTASLALYTPGSVEFVIKAWDSLNNQGQSGVNLFTTEICFG